MGKAAAWNQSTLPMKMSLWPEPSSAVLKSSMHNGAKRVAGEREVHVKLVNLNFWWGNWPQA